ncbi:MmgE/PrpD family protein [Bradyrhizobium hipponense]|uniref:MmgE/PrpD family protein n=1 Tax=Bradyrhizobium hipponense TaxID=2605638 RepID=A0A5S4Y8V7_9BRAD|nr:MmgE/PrpD family protein [Bradyrhizobium hipponense]TYO60881.1 MmgE/PrpD family protein [Bradyrhizobium hipponense]
MSLTGDIGTFLAELSLKSLPDDVTEKARTCLLNGYGMALACHNIASTRVARSAALALDGESPNGATVLAHGGKVSVSNAVLANAALFHGRGQEDTVGAVHVGAMVIPLLTALFETRRLPMERFIPALVASYEVGGVLDDAYAQFSTPRGLRSSPLYGPMACAAAAAKAMGLPAERIAAAIGNAASLGGGGMLQCFADGTDEWVYQMGVASNTGLAAAELARAGSLTAPHAIEGKRGFVSTFAQKECEADAIASKFGRDWAIHRVTFKPYPACASNQTAVAAALELSPRLDGREIESIRVRLNPYDCGSSGGMYLKGPFSTSSMTGLSIPFCVALALRRGAPTMAALSNFNDAEVNALAQRIDLVADDAVPRLCSVISVDLANGDKVVQEKKATTETYNFDRQAVSSLIRRIGAEEGVPRKAYDLIEGFVAGLPRADIADVIHAFVLCPST